MDHEEHPQWATQKVYQTLTLIMHVLGAQVAILVKSDSTVQLWAELPTTREEVMTLLLEAFRTVHDSKPTVLQEGAQEGETEQ